MTGTALIAFGPTITVDTHTGVDGRHHVTSEYAETFWLPVIGPSCWCLLRRFAAHEGTVTYDTDVLARSIGLSAGTVNSSMGRTLNRLVHFHLAQQVASEPNRLLVRSWLPAVPARLLTRLPLSLQDQHWRLAQAVTA